ncbi:MAG: alpha/beta fold hydrolase [Patescibacteria group bacterium]|nr:alpha/beta fold hydrolase [Patescibacteria group bacterium]
MKNILILHGAGNNSSGNWFPWLKWVLAEKGYQVWSPDLPNSETPILEDWLDTVFANKDWDFNQESVIVGHSSGATLILRILEKLPPGKRIDKAILVAGFADKGSIPELSKYKADLLKIPFNWNKIKDSCQNFFFFASDNDPYDCGIRQSKIMQEKNILTWKLVKNINNFRYFWNISKS